MDDIDPRTTIDDSDRYYVAVSPTCEACRHRIGHGYLACAAFTRRIPREIWNGDRDHTSPYPGDHGIRFEPMTEEDKERKKRLRTEAQERIEQITERARALREAVGAPKP